MNICMCGAQAGYPHDLYCPFPLFHGSDAMIERWEEQRQVLVNAALMYDDVLRDEEQNPLPDGFGPQGHGT